MDYHLSTNATPDNPLLPALPDHTFPVLNHNRTLDPKFALSSQQSFILAMSLVKATPENIVL